MARYPRCPGDKTVPWQRNWCINVNSTDFGWMGYSLRTHTPTGGWRYTAWLLWNGSTGPGRAVFPNARLNGTGGFFEELFEYPASNCNESAFDHLDTKEVSASNPGVAAELYQQLKAMLTS